MESEPGLSVTWPDHSAFSVKNGVLSFTGALFASSQFLPCDAFTLATEVATSPNNHPE